MSFLHVALWLVLQAVLTQSRGLLEHWPCQLYLNGNLLSNDADAIALFQATPKHELIEINVSSVPCAGFLKQTQFVVRAQANDFDVMRDVFLRHEFVFLDTLFPASPPRTIMDLGANVGMAAAYFSDRFPDAKVVSVEPSLYNFATASMNVMGKETVAMVYGAVWEQEQRLGLIQKFSGEW
jgi:predicted O-methyltransferase YrrM